MNYDAIIIGAGTSGLNIARELSRAGWQCLGLEAGMRYDRTTYPTTEIDAEALDPWRKTSGVHFLNPEDMEPYYTRAEGNIALQTVPEDRRNRNAEVFADGFTTNGYQHAPLRRAQADCHFEDGNSCIMCLSGCRVDSKQSTAVTALPVAEEHGFTLQDRIEVRTIKELPDHVEVTDSEGRIYRGGIVNLASGAIGNSALLLRSGYGAHLPALGKNFHTHPQYMNVGIYDEPVRSFEGPLQNYKSADPGFRRQGFKLENVFAGPASMALLMPSFGAQHRKLMTNFEQMGCIEVCVRDTEPGRIRAIGRASPSSQRN